MLTRHQFMEQKLWPAALNAGALIAGFNLPFDPSRLAVDCRQARRRNEGWSLVMSQDKDPFTGRIRDNPFQPRIRIQPRDSKSAFINLTGVSIRSKKQGRRLKQYKPGRILDLRTLGWALRNESFSLQRACKAFGVSGKLDHEPTGRITAEEIEYCRQDVRATTNLLNAMRAEADLHPIDRPEHALSPASIAKSYFKSMGLIPPLQKFSIPTWAQGAAMQAYYGGRAECRIRQTIVPIIYTDFLSEYPTVNTLMGLWKLLIAKELIFKDATEDVRKMLSSITLEKAFNKEIWGDLVFFALVSPTRDILPVRTYYNGKNSNIGINPLTSSEPIWYAGPDVVTATLLTGRPPEILRAFRVVPVSRQAGLRSVSLRGMVDINPAKGDFFKAVIEARYRVKSDQRLPPDNRDALAYFLKILANAGSYGLFMEVNPEHVGKGHREKIRVSSGEKSFETTSTVVENPGTWYCPLFAALITAGGRLLLALLERSVTDLGGAYLLCDTDSMAIVASEKGGPVPCMGGAHRVADADEGIQALSWAQVEGIVQRFHLLNPYEGDFMPRSILKIEDVNRRNGVQVELKGYAIAAKRYALFVDSASDFEIVSAKAHGLGFLLPPSDDHGFRADAPAWVIEAWAWILRGVLGLPQVDPPWFGRPAMMRLRITTPEVLKALQGRQKDLAYRDRVKPFNFILSPIVDRIGGHPLGTDPDRFTLVTPFTLESGRWYRLRYTNVHDGKVYRLTPPDRHRPSEARAKTCGDFVSEYRWHPEAKSLGPDGRRCDRKTQGLLKRTPVNVTANDFRYIGKETDRKWEQGEDISLLESETLEYRPGETARLVADPELREAVYNVSIRRLAKEAGVSENTVKAARRGERQQRRVVAKLWKAVRALLK
jgi:hypothetical protein